MTQEGKELVFRDICSRLPYWVKVSHNGVVYDAIGYAHGKIEVCMPFSSKTQWVNIDEIKPYLRPMSSMTEEEQLELSVVPIYARMLDNASAQIDWLNAHHFDYRGLIPRGLALSTDKFNPYKD